MTRTSTGAKRTGAERGFRDLSGDERGIAVSAMVLLAILVVAVAAFGAVAVQRANSVDDDLPTIDF